VRTIRVRFGWLLMYEPFLQLSPEYEFRLVGPIALSGSATGTRRGLSSNWACRRACEAAERHHCNPRRRGEEECETTELAAITPEDGGVRAAREPTGTTSASRARDSRELGHLAGPAATGHTRCSPLQGSQGNHVERGQLVAPCFAGVLGEGGT
jgi:hypothetical protein